MYKSSDDPPMTPPAETAWLGPARTSGFLSRLPDALVASVVKGAQRVEYPAGTIGLRWEESPKAAIVLRGTLRSFISYPDGSQVTTRYLKAGDMTGVFASRQPALARGVQAIDRSELLFIGGERMKEISLAEPRVGWALHEGLTTGLNCYPRAPSLRAFGSLRTPG